MEEEKARAPKSLYSLNDSAKEIAVSTTLCHQALSSCLASMDVSSDSWQGTTKAEIKVMIKIARAIPPKEFPCPFGNRDSIVVFTGKLSKWLWLDFLQKDTLIEFGRQRKIRCQWDHSFCRVQSPRGSAVGSIRLPCNRVVQSIGLLG